MLRAQRGELSVAAVVAILLADVVLANVIVQPGYGQPTAYHSSYQPETSPHEENENKHQPTTSYDENVRYAHQYQPADYYQNEGQPRSFGYPTQWQTPHALPVSHANVPKIVHPLRVTKIGGYGYVQPSYMVGHPQYPLYAVPESRHRRSVDEKGPGDSDAVATNPTITDTPAKLSDARDGNLEDLQLTPIEEIDETREKREKRTDVHEPKNAESVSHYFGLNPEKMQPGYHQYRPPIMMQQIRRSQFSPPYPIQSEQSTVIQQVTPPPEKQSAPAPPSQGQQASANADDNGISNTESQTKRDNRKQRISRKKKSENADSPNKNQEEMSSHQHEPQIVIHNVPAQPVKRQGLFGDSVNINIDSDNTMLSGNPNYPSASGPSGPIGPTGPFNPGVSGIQDDVSLQSDFMLGSTQRCHHKTCGYRNFPDPRPHKHNKCQQCNTYPRYGNQQQQVATAANKDQEDPVAQTVMESANPCDCQPSLAQPYSFRNSFYIVPVSAIQPLHMNRVSMLGCNDMNAMLGRAQQVYQIPQEQIDAQTAETLTARYAYPQYYNYMPSYRSAYTMPYYERASPSYTGCGCGTS